MSDEINTQAVIEEATAKAEAVKEIPAGYVNLLISTHGAYDCPASFHIRNYDINEAFELGSIAPEEMPVKICESLQKLIWEPEADVRNMLEGEVTEMVIKFYVSFYQRYIKDLDYAKYMTEADKKWVIDNVYGGHETQAYKDWLLGVETGRVPLKFDIDLTKVRFHKIPSEPQKTVHYSKPVIDPNTFKETPFSCDFGLPKFGDAAIVQLAMEKEFANEDKRYATTYANYKHNQEVDRRLLNGEKVDSNSKFYIPDNELREVKKYELRKTKFTMDMMKGMYIKKIDGKDVSDLPLAERIKLVNEDHRIDYNCWQTVSSEFQNLAVGPINKIEINNPITGGKSEIDFTFRALDLLAHIKNFRSDNADVKLV